MSRKQHEAGTIIISDRESDRVLRFATLQCVHCGMHWVPQPGSGRVRGFCMNCSGPVCSKECAACVPYMQQIENIEQGRPLDFKPICVRVSD